MKIYVIVRYPLSCEHQGKVNTFSFDAIQDVRFAKPRKLDTLSWTDYDDDRVYPEPFKTYSLPEMVQFWEEEGASVEITCTPPAEKDKAVLREPIVITTTYPGHEPDEPFIVEGTLVRQGGEDIPLPRAVQRWLLSGVAVQLEPFAAFNKRRRERDFEIARLRREKGIDVASE